MALRRARDGRPLRPARRCARERGPPRLRRPVRPHRRRRAAHPDRSAARRSSTGAATRHGSAASTIEPPWLDWAGFLYDANLAGLPALRACRRGSATTVCRCRCSCSGRADVDGAVLAAGRGGRAARRLRHAGPSHLTQSPDVQTTMEVCDGGDRDRRCTGWRTSARSSGRTRRRSTSSRRRRSTCWGIDRWVRNFFYVTYFDSFEGRHPRVFVPRNRPRARVQVDRGRLQLPARPQGGASTWSTRTGPGGKATFVMFDEETEALRGRARPRDHPPARGAAEAARLEDRHHADRQRGRRAQRPQRARPRRDLRRAVAARRQQRAGRRPGRADALRRLRQDHVLHPLAGDWDSYARRPRRPGAQGDAADHAAGGRASRP